MGTTEHHAIRPFRIEVPDAELSELRKRINATNWPERETVTDASQACSSRRPRNSRAIGDRIRLAQMRGEIEALPQFITEIDGLDIHSFHPRAVET